MVSLSRKWIALLLVDILTVIFAILFTNSTLMILILVVWSNGFIYSLYNIEEKGVLFSFLLSFFFILIGREALEVFGLHTVEAVFPKETNELAERLVLLALISLLIGYVLARKVFFTKAVQKEKDYNTIRYVSIRKASSILFYLTFAFNIFTVLDIVAFVTQHGYIMYYTSYISNVPYIIKKLGDMCVICFWIFLATMPEKPKVNRMSIFYIFYLLSTLGTGKRFPFVAGLVTLFIYYLARNRINPGPFHWIRKKTMAILFVSAPFLVVILYIIGQVRMDNSMSEFRMSKVISDFLYGQGVSINVIKRAQMYESQLPQGKYYLLGNTIETLSNNLLFRSLGATQYAGNTVEHAINGYSFQHALSYTTMGDYYLAGHGLGSCYLAEAFHDLGYFGVIIVNLIYGVVICKVFDFRRHGIWGTALILSMLNSFLLAPRGSADGFLTDIVDLTFWGTVFSVWIFSKVFIRKVKIRDAKSDGSDGQ